MKQQSFLVLLYNGKCVKIGGYSGVFYFQILRLSQRSINSTSTTWFDNFNPSCTQKRHHIVVPRLAGVPHKPQKTIGHRRSKWLELYFRLLLSASLSSRSQWYPFWNLDIPTSQSALKRSYSEETNSENNDDKARKPTLGSHSISVN